MLRLFFLNIEVLFTNVIYFLFSLAQNVDAFSENTLELI